MDIFSRVWTFKEHFEGTKKKNEDWISINVVINNIQIVWDFGLGNSCFMFIFGFKCYITTLGFIHLAQVCTHHRNNSIKQVGVDIHNR